MRSALDASLPPAPVARSARPRLARRGVLIGLSALAVLTLPRPLLGQSPPAPSASLARLADLRRLAPAGDNPGPVFVRAALADGDQGGGWFFWHADSQARDDGGCVLAPDDAKPGRWQRLYSGPVDVRWFGARGDGRHDDAPAIQRAADHHGDLYLPAGVYRLARPLDLTAVWGRRLSGAGQTANPGSPGGFEEGRLSAASTLLLDADDAPVLRLSGSGNVVERLCLMAKTRQPRDRARSYGIELQAVSRSRLSDLRIFNCATGIGLPQQALARDGRSNWLFDSTLANVDINHFSRCGLDLRNFEGGGTGVALSQIYMSNIADGSSQARPELYEADHFILGHNWAEYVLQAVHCEWALCRDAPIRLHNCNATISGLHLEGLRFAPDVAAVIRLEGGHAGLRVDAMQLYDCRLAGGPSSPDLPLVATAARTARVALSSVRLANTLVSDGGRRIAAGRVLGGDGAITLDGLIDDSKIYASPRPDARIAVRP